jgi:hypothetical protein
LTGTVSQSPTAETIIFTKFTQNGRRAIHGTRSALMALGWNRTAMPIMLIIHPVYAKIMTGKGGIGHAGKHT